MQTAIQTALSAELLSTVPSTIAAATSLQEECSAAVSRIDADTDADSVLTLMSNVAAAPVFDPAQSPVLSIVSSMTLTTTEHATILVFTLSQLVRSDLNVRRKEIDVAELKNLIRHQGLLQNLVGFRQEVDGVVTGLIEVVAGGRRLQAIAELIADGELPVDYGIPVLLVDASEAIAISMAENLGRADMHPADVFVAMQALIALGRSLEDVALHFQLDLLAVKRRLKLANVSPRLLDLYRRDQASFEHMMALALVDDHAVQEAAWDSLPAHNPSAHELRRLLTAQKLNIRTDRLVRFVGVSAFEKAGGVVMRDLFSSEGDGYISDVVLLEKLAKAKFDKQRSKLLKQGVGWADVLPRADYAELATYAAVRCERQPLTAEQQAALNALQERESALEELIDQAVDNEDDDTVDALDAEFQSVQAQISEIEQARVSVANPDEAVMAGAIITLDRDGSLLIRQQVLRPADRAKQDAVKVLPDAAPKRVKNVHSDRLTFELTSQRTVALQAAMASQPQIALAYLTHTLMLAVWGGKVGLDRGLRSQAHISVEAPHLAEVVADSAAALKLTELEQNLQAWLAEARPDERRGYLGWLLRQPQERLLALLAYFVSTSLTTVQYREADAPEYDQLAQMLQLDMHPWWRAKAANYFSHVSKEQMMKVVSAVAGLAAAVPLEKMTKAAAAEAAERAVAASGWLPAMLCSHSD